METTLSCQTETGKPAGEEITLLRHSLHLAPEPPATIAACQAPHFIWQHRKVNVRHLLWLEVMESYGRREGIERLHCGLHSDSSVRR